MPDPQRDLAPIIGPAPPPALPAEGGYLLPGILVLLGLALGMGLAWYWRRQSPQWALRRLAAASDPRLAGDRLAAMISRRHRLSRLQADACPPALAGKEDDWNIWVRDLERLRFAAPCADDAALLMRLIRTGRDFIGRGRR
jgi:hypothetical protein